MPLPPRPTFVPAVVYKDPKAALAWLEQAFGFESSMVILGPDDELMHAEMQFGDGLIMVGREWSERHHSPAGIGGSVTQSVHVHLTDDIDAHCERARAAGATIDEAPATQFYGDRTYRCRDLEGHIWTFGQTVQEMTTGEWDAVGGVTTRTRL